MMFSCVLGLVRIVGILAAASVFGSAAQAREDHPWPPRQTAAKDSMDIPYVLQTLNAAMESGIVGEETRYT